MVARARTAATCANAVAMGPSARHADAAGSIRPSRRCRRRSGRRARDRLRPSPSALDPWGLPWERCASHPSWHPARRAGGGRVLLRRRSQAGAHPRRGGAARRRGAARARRRDPARARPLAARLADDPRAPSPPPSIAGATEGDLGAHPPPARGHALGAPPAAHPPAPDRARAARRPGGCAAAGAQRAAHLRATFRARRGLGKITPPTPGPLPHRAAGAAARACSAHYRAAQRRFGVRWPVLAAVNFVESALRAHAQLERRRARRARCSSSRPPGRPTGWAAT